MQGKSRTKAQKQALYEQVEPYLKEGLSLRKACEITQVPYTTMRDIMENDLLLRTKMSVAQHELLSLAWKNVRKQIENGDVKASQWYIEKMGTAEPLSHAYEGGEKERKERSDGHLHAAIFGPKSTETIIEVLEDMDAERSHS
jgi:hypothetical protein